MEATDDRREEIEARERRDGEVSGREMVAAMAMAACGVGVETSLFGEQKQRNREVGAYTTGKGVVVADLAMGHKTAKPIFQNTWFGLIFPSALIFQILIFFNLIFI